LKPSVAKEVMKHISEKTPAQFGLKWDPLADLLKAAKPEVVMIPQERGSGLGDELRVDPYYKEQKGYVYEVMQERGLTMINANIVKAQVLRRMRTIIKKAFGKELAPPTMPKDHAGLADQFDPVFSCLVKGGYHLAMSTENHLIESHMIIEGTMFVVGVKVEAVTGSSLDQKYVTVANLDVQTFMALANSNGFLAKVGKDATLVVPPGYFLLYMNNTETDLWGMTWKMIGTSANAGVSLNLLQAQVKAAGGSLPVGTSADLLVYLAQLAGSLELELELELERHDQVC
jgi:hypothetical protein